MGAGDLLKIDMQLAPFLALVDALAPADTAAAQLRWTLGELRPFLDGSAPDRTAAEAEVARDTFAAAFKTFVDRWRNELTRALLGQLPELPAIRDLLSDADWLSADGINGHATLGPLTLRVGLGSVIVPVDAMLNSGSVSLEPLALGPSRIDRVGATLVGPFPGDGALQVLGDGFSGGLRLPLGAVTVDALASLRRTPSGGPSFLGILGVGFTPAIQLSFGFAMDRVGGVIGVERRVDVDAVSHGIRTGTATDVLFAPSGSDLARKLIAAETFFPPQAGSHVVGPTFGLAWLSAGAGLSLAHADLAVLVQLGGPVTITIVGKASLELSELLRMRADIAGSFDGARGLVAVDVSLVEARVLGAFRLTGDAAFRLTTAAGGGVVFSAGGFYPGFDPKPVEVGPLRRLSFGTDIPTPGLDIRVEGYFAATSNTIQLGGRLDLVFDAALVVARGSIGMDALIQLRPFHFRAEISGRVSVEFLGDTYCGVQVDASVEGPGPISINARLTIETFLKDIPWNETFTFGSGDADRAGRATSLLQEIADHAKEPGVLRASSPDDPDVVLNPRPISGVVTGPLGELIWSQRFSPLAIRCDRLKSEPLTPPGQQVEVEVLAPAKSNGYESEPFAPGSFLNLPENLAMMFPAFDLQISGLRIGFETDSADSASQPLANDVVLIRPELPVLTFSHTKALLDEGWSRKIANVGLAAPRVWTETASVTKEAESWQTADGAEHLSASIAWQHARYGSGGVPRHPVDPVLDIGAI